MAWFGVAPAHERQLFSRCHANGQLFDGLDHGGFLHLHCREPNFKIGNDLGARGIIVGVFQYKRITQLGIFTVNIHFGVTERYGACELAF